MSIVSWFGFATTSESNCGELPALFNLSCTEETFIRNDITALYKKILGDVMQRTYGLTDEQQISVWDNCLKSEASRGLISLLAEAMYAKSELFLVYKEGVLRKADNNETDQIKLDYSRSGSSSVGVYVSFKELTLSTMLILYSQMEYSVLGSLNKKMNVSNAIQFKMDKLRGSVGAVDKAQIEIQAKTICNALSNGKNVLLDGEDNIESPTVQMDSTEQAIEFLDGKRSFITGLPLAYINGQQTTGIGSTGQADSKAIDRGLKYYFISIFKPVCEALFNTKVSFVVSEDSSSLASALEALKTFELLQVDNAILSADEQRNIVRKLLGLESQTS